MKSEDWSLIDSLVEAAFDLPASERLPFIEAECSNQPELKRQVSALLDADDCAGGFLESPPQVHKACLKAPVLGDEPWLRGRIGPYRLLEEVAFSGRTRVYRAVRDDGAFRKHVAIKLVEPAGTAYVEGGLVQRFRVERQILARLEHPAIARLLDGGEVGHRLYLVLEFVDGQPIDLYCAWAGLGLEQRLRLFLKALDAVALAHEHLIVHRDLKPSNLLVTADGQPKLLDFGIAKVLRPAAWSEEVEATRTGLRPMTLAWAAPEQVRGEAITTATDVYALGLLLYQLLTGERAYAVETLAPRDVEAMICDRDPLPPSRRVALGRHSGGHQTEGGSVDISADRLAGDLDAIVLTALAKDPARRYRSVRRLADDLRAYLAGQPVSAGPATWRYRTVKFLGRHRTGAAVAATAGLVLGALLVALAMQTSRLASERDQAQVERQRAETVTAFLVQTFAEAHPNRAQGREVSVREVMAHGRYAIERLEDQPEIQMRLLFTLGEVHSAIGEGVQSVALLHRARSQALKVFGERSLEVASADHRLGQALLRTDQFDEAHRAITAAHLLRQELAGPRAAETMTSLALLGRVRLYQGFWKEAEHLLSTAVAGLEAALTERHETTLGFYGDLGMAKHKVGDVLPARELFERRFTLAKAELGELHPMTIEAELDLTNWGEDRLSRKEEALRKLENVLGPHHREVARALIDIAYYILRQDSHRAIELASRALEIDQREWGDGTWALATNHSILGLAAEHLGDLETAEHHLLLAVDNARRGTPATNPSRYRPLMRWIGFLIDRERFEEAKPYAEELRKNWRSLPHRDPEWAAVPEAAAALVDLNLGDGTARQRFLHHGSKVLSAFDPNSPMFRQIRVGFEQLGAEPEQARRLGMQ